MAEHEVKEQDKSDELVDMIEKLMEDGSGHLTISEDDLMGEGLNIAAWIARKGTWLAVSRLSL